MKNICDCMSYMNLDEAVRIANGLKVKIDFGWFEVQEERSCTKLSIFKILCN